MALKPGSWSHKDRQISYAEKWRRKLSEMSVLQTGQRAHPVAVAVVSEDMCNTIVRLRVRRAFHNPELRRGLERGGENFLRRKHQAAECEATI